jgi:SAM-dependent methyltransferase
MQMSLRDPGGQTCMLDKRFLRIVNSDGLHELTAFLRCPLLPRFIGSNQLVNSSVLDAAATAELLVQRGVRELYEDCEGVSIIEHDRVEFPSFPYEWSPEMLHAAGKLTLDLAENLVEEGWGLKDASPYNVLFRGPDPIFVDLLSFERRSPHDPTWTPLAQFTRTFLLPLLVNKYFGVGLAQQLTTHRDGIEPDAVYRLAGPMQKYLPPFLSLVSIPMWLTPSRPENIRSIYRRRAYNDAEKAAFVFRRVLKNARRHLDALAPSTQRASRWSDYTEESNYSPRYQAIKRDLIRDILCAYKPKRVLDIGCNTGRFSILAAKLGAKVIAIDSDPVVIGKLWRRAATDKLDILPLVVDVTRPSASTGWRNRECPSFLDRARDEFDLVLMLGVIHHLLVTERIPLSQVIELAAELTTKLLVIEFVAPDDQMFSCIARGREDLYRDLTRNVFDKACSVHFEVLECKRLDQTSRWLYLMRKKETVIECLETQQ